MNHQDHMKIGRYHSWFEDGKLKLYSHSFGDVSGFSCTLNAEEAQGLLELLSRHREEINHALFEHEQQGTHHYVAH
jgi:class 3 adenylate cyclase